jgi:hypothetical protein
MMPAIRVVSPANYEQNGAGGVGHLSAHSVLQDDLLVLLGAMIRSAVNRLLRRGKHCRLPVSANLRASVNPLKSICWHVGMKYLHQMQGKDKCCYVFVAIELPAAGCLLSPNGTRLQPLPSLSSQQCAKQCLQDTGHRHRQRQRLSVYGPAVWKLQTRLYRRVWD